MKHASPALATLLACLLALPVAALGKPKAPTTPAPEPFGLHLGVTTEAQARAALAAEKAQVTARGNVDARPDTQVDNNPQGLPNPRAVLMDVTGLPMPGVESTRLGFFDDHLYQIRYRFALQHDAHALMEQLKAKYGEPTEGGELVHTYEWRFVDVTLTFRDEVLGADTLTFVHDKLQQAMVASSAALWQQQLSSKAGEQRGF